MKAVQVKTELIDWLKEERGKGYARWGLIELGGMKWLIRVCVTGDIYYGGLFFIGCFGGRTAEKRVLFPIWRCIFWRERGVRRQEEKNFP